MPEQEEHMEPSQAPIEIRKDETASAMARYALEDLSQTQGQAKIGVYCGFVADYVEAHPDWKDAVQINRSAFIATNSARDTASGH
jgi:hypothetical protein